MKLNPDCIRDLLLTVEENTDFSRMMNFPSDKNYELLNKYDNEEVFYHIKQSELSGLLTKVDWFLGCTCMIRDLSPKGHEFLANIRAENNWSKTKEIANNIGSTSLGAITQIASNVITALISKQLGI